MTKIWTGMTIIAHIMTFDINLSTAKLALDMLPAMTYLCKVISKYIYE